MISRHASAWTPLAVPAFRAVWIASLASNIAIWLGNVGMAWLMTELRPTPVMVTLVQAATSLPVFLFALPAGAVGDLVDRRSLLGVLQIASALLSVGLGVSTALGLTTPALILAAAFFLGTTLAFGMPVFQAIVPDLVPLRELAPAVSLNSIGINIARVIGPALGGAMILYWGAAAPFLINTVFYAAVIFLLYRCLPALPAMHRGVRMGTAVLDGIRHTLGSPAARATLIRSGGYAFFASMYFSLLPLIARDQVGGGAGVYGLLLGCLGSGGIVSVILLPRWRLRRSPDSVARAGSVASAVLLVAIAPTHSEWLMVPLLLAAGLAWVAQVATVNVAAQSMLPGWVRARGLSIFMIVFNGMMALGSALWGLIASVVGLSWAFALSGCGLLLFEAAAARCRLPGDDFAGTAKLDEPRDLARSATVE
ncbi:MAG TPA: MFS transporter [Stellaceae bacterium]|nr:MFS transporter [Stellaceae bacterium]